MSLPLAYARGSGTDLAWLDLDVVRQCLEYRLAAGMVWSRVPPAASRYSKHCLLLVRV